MLEIDSTVGLIIFVLYVHNMVIATIVCITLLRLIELEKRLKYIISFFLDFEIYLSPLEEIYPPKGFCNSDALIYIDQRIGGANCRPPSDTRALAVPTRDNTQPDIVSEPPTSASQVPSQNESSHASP